MPILDKLYTLKNAREQLEESAQVIQAKSRDDVGMIVAAWEDPGTPRQAAARPSVQRSDLESESRPPKLRSNQEPRRVPASQPGKDPPRRELPILDKFYTLKKEVYFFMPGVKILLPLQRYTCQQWQMNHFIWFGWIPRDGVPAIF